MTILKRYSPYILTFFLLLFYFVPRYFAHRQFDVLEDELLSVQTNLDYTFLQQFEAPDPAHPMIWYMLMEIPVSIIGISHGIFYYRLIQVILLLLIIIITKKFFTKKTSTAFFITFLLLLLSNVTILHLSIQNRMFALVFGISIMYCFAWVDIIKDKNPISFKKFVLLGTIATLGFLTNYSILWILPIWPILYIVNEFSIKRIQQVFVLSITFLIGVSWYLPTFYHNTIGSVSSNQWAPQVNFFNTKELIGEYFGLLSVVWPINTLNPFFYPLVIIFLFILILWLKNRSNTSKFKKLFIPIILSFLLFVLVSKLTGNRLFYTRTSLPIVFTGYLLITEIASKKNFLTWTLIGVVIIIQFSQFLIYFFLIPTDRSYSVFNYVHHPQAYFQGFNFPVDSCLVPLPSWNYLSLQYFFGEKTKVIPTYDFFIKKTTNGCSYLYLMDQTSVDRNIIYPYFEKLNEMDISYTPLLENENQLLYELNIEKK